MKLECREGRSAKFVYFRCNLLLEYSRLLQKNKGLGQMKWDAKLGDLLMDQAINGHKLRNSW